MILSRRTKTCVSRGSIWDSGSGRIGSENRTRRRLFQFGALRGFLGLPLRFLVGGWGWFGLGGIALGISGAGWTGVGRPGCGRGQLSTLARRSALVGVGEGWITGGLSVLGLISGVHGASEAPDVTVGVVMVR